MQTSSTASVPCENSSRRIVAVVLRQLLTELAVEQHQLRETTARPTQALQKGSPRQPHQQARRQSAASAREPMVVVLCDSTDTPPSTVAAVEVDPASSQITSSQLSDNKITDTTSSETSQLQKTTIAAVNESAHAYGVRSGQTIAEACAWVANLHIQQVDRARVQLALERVAESLGQFAQTVSIGGLDTIWLDISNSQQLYPDEHELLREISACVSAVGHSCRTAIARGPLLAQAFARWAPVQRNSKQPVQRNSKQAVQSHSARSSQLDSPQLGRGQRPLPPERGQLGLVVEDAQTVKLAAQLPIRALPVSSRVQCWLAGLGILHWADLGRLPAKQAISRLGPNAQLALDLVAGRDTRPLIAFAPPRHPQERQEWDEPASGSQPLLFVLRGLVSKISSRLEGRALAAQSLRLVVFCDRGIARLRNVEPRVELDYSLASPLYRTDDLWRVLSPRLEKLVLKAPSIGLELKVCSLAAASRRQLDLMSASSKLHTDPERLQVLLSELSADIGPRTFGVLRMNDSHRPEKVSLLQPLAALQAATLDHAKRSRRSTRGQTQNDRGQKQLPQSALQQGDSSQQSNALQHGVPLKHGESLRQGDPRENWAQLPPRQISLESSRTSIAPAEQNFPNRLLPKPLLLDQLLTKGAFVPFAGQLFSVEEIRFGHRLDCVEWWSGESISRDYFRVTLSSGKARVSVLAYRNRHTGSVFLQGLFD